MKETNGSFDLHKDQLQFKIDMKLSILALIGDVTCDENVWPENVISGTPISDFPIDNLRPDLLIQYRFQFTKIPQKSVALVRRSPTYWKH